ncbi:hypothetical protein AGMMS49593_01700 [Endomicrobiia bacterium]|nr:hypothetical protein AGMMS49593_01700 [Endomicrobiia bacterium]
MTDHRSSVKSDKERKDDGTTVCNVTSDKEMLSEEDKFYSEAQVAWDAVKEALEALNNGGDRRDETLC